MQPFIVNFHGIGNSVRPYEPGEQRYWINRAEFIEVLGLFQRISHGIDTRITIDDGNSSDYEIIAPELIKRNMKATFFVLAGKFDQPGYVSRSQIQELSDWGFQIGSHGLDHVDWTQASDAILRQELSNSKAIIEGVIGRPVVSAAIPFGSYDKRVLQFLRRYDYREVFSSDGGPRLVAPAWPTPRYSVRTGFDLLTLEKLFSDRSLLHRCCREMRIRAKSAVRRSTIKTIGGWI